MERVSSFRVFLFVSFVLKSKYFGKTNPAFFMVAADFEIEKKQLVWGIRPGKFPGLS